MVLLILDESAISDGTGQGNWGHSLLLHVFILQLAGLGGVLPVKADCLCSSSGTHCIDRREELVHRKKGKSGWEQWLSSRCVLALFSSCCWLWATNDTWQNKFSSPKEMRAYSLLFLVALPSGQQPPFEFTGATELESRNSSFWAWDTVWDVMDTWLLMKTLRVKLSCLCQWAVTSRSPHSSSVIALPLTDGKFLDGLSIHFEVSSFCLSLPVFPSFPFLPPSLFFFLFPPSNKHFSVVKCLCSIYGTECGYDFPPFSLHT